MFKCLNCLNTLKAVCVSCNESEVKTLITAAKNALPLLINLGDFTGNANNRCEVIGELRQALENLKAIEHRSCGTEHFY